MTGPAIEFDRVSVHYGRTVALSELSLQVRRGETVALLGPSGSGKSTALKALAGFVRPSTGRVRLAGRDVTDLAPHRRDLGVVVQQYALFGHLRVADNVAFGLRARRTPRAAVRERVAEMLELVGMTGFARRYPRELSGGQQQRVAIARALAIRPDVLLLDEPLSALDAALRADLVGELQRLRAELPDVSILYVTHDQGEALALADRIGVLRDARLVDLGPTEALYRRPPSRFTARFLGGANVIPARAGRRDGDTVQVTVAGSVTVSADTSAALHDGDDALLVVRPHAVRVAATATGAALPARLTGIQWRGHSYRLAASLADGTGVTADVSTLDGLPAVGAPVWLSFPSDRHVVPA